MNISVKPYKYVIGLTGPIASGKGLAVKAIRKEFAGKTIQSVLISDLIRDVVRANGLPLNRDTLREAGNSLRKQEGSGAWAQAMLSQLPVMNADVLIVDSIRTPGEIEVLRKEFGDRVFILATDAPIEDRVRRVLMRARLDDSTDPKEVERAMRIEMEDNPEFGFAIERCREMADGVSIGKESKEERVDEIQEWVKSFVERFEGGEARRETQLRRVA